MQRQGAAQHTPRLILIRPRNRTRGQRKWTRRVGCGVTDVVPDHTMKLRAAALRSGVDDGPAGAAVLSAVIVGRYAKFIDGVEDWLNRLIGKALVVDAVTVVIQTIENEIVPGTAQAVDVVGSIAAGGALVFETRCLHARSQFGQIRVLAAVERKV